jgi:tRNA(fMet)-specific endonuclease VapC
MKRFLLDSNAVNALINRHDPFSIRIREARKNGDRIGTCEPVIAELFYGFEFSTTRDQNIVRLERALSSLLSWPFDRRAAREYGRIAAELRRRGRPIQVVDMMIAAIALTLENCVVVTTDSDLSAVPGLAVVNWAAPPEGQKRT